MIYSFDTQDAILYGVDRAVILYNLRFWLTKNQANEKHLHEYTSKDEEHPHHGKQFYWTYNSAKAFERLFPFWSANKIQKDLKWLEKEGIILLSSFNKSGYDRTKWYSMPCFSSFSQMDECNQPNGEKHSAKPLNSFSQKAEPIPDSKPDNKPDIKDPCASYDELVNEQFKILWQSYHNKKSKPDAERAFKKFSKKYKADTLPNMVKLLISGIAGRLRANEIGISNILLASYLNKEKYNDECVVTPEKTNGNDKAKELFDNATIYKMPK